MKKSPHGDWKDIEYYMIGKHTYTLTYVPDAESNYDRIASWSDFGEGMKIVKTEGTTERIAKEKYVTMMQKFGEMIGAKRLSVLEMVCDS